MGGLIVKERTFKRKFIIAFIKIIVLSLIFSLVSFFIWALTFNYVRYPANYYEKQIGDIAKVIVENHDDVLDKRFQKNMESFVPKGGISYQVLDEYGNFLYGTLEEKIIKNREELITSINSNKIIGNKQYAKIIPVLGRNSDFKGAVVLVYKIESTKKTDSQILLTLSNMVILFPFAFIIIFTLIYAKKLSKEINKPVTILLNAAEMIKNQNLNFTIDYDENNEFSKLCNAFESMRKNLKESLIRQWDLEEKRRENIGNIAHDLKTPLTIVNTYTEAILDGTVKGERIREYLEVIKRNNERALALVMDLNTLHNIENPDFILHPMEVDIVDFLNSKEKDYKFLCQERGIDFVVKVEDLREKNFMSKFDIRSLEQVLDNCISNSIRYTEKGELIEIRAKCRDEVIEFSIIDTGKGFSDEDLKNIFNKFYKGDKSRSFSSGHSGLGMYISKIIVEKHGGYIEAKNNVPKGAIIQFNIKPIGNQIS